MIESSATLRAARAVLFSLLVLNFACDRTKKTETSSQLPDKIAPPVLSSFEFETVTLDAKGKVTDRRRLRAESYKEDLGNGIELEMVLIPAGTIMLGSPTNEKGRLWTEGPQHSVKFSQFYMGKFEVTQAQWRAVAGLPKVDRDLKAEPSSFKGGDLPVEQVSWHDAEEFCKRLSKKARRGYRLPSEAEWEYAARGGASAPFAFGEMITPDVVNYNGNFPYADAAVGINRGKTVPVGSLGVANAFGLYDVHGNVEEWCLDNWHDTYDGAPADGSAWTIGGDPEYQLIRGGSFYSSANYCRSSQRSWLGPQFSFNGIGFRVVAVA